MMPVVPSVKRANGFSIDSLMGNKSDSSCPCSSSSAHSGGATVTETSMSSSSIRDAAISSLTAAAFHPVASAHHLMNSMKSHYHPEASPYPDGLVGHFGLGHHPSLGAHIPHSLAAHSGISPHMHPMLLGAQRDPFPFYPWLMARHGSYLTHRLGGPEASLLLQPFRKPKRIRTAFSPSQLLRLEHAFEKNHYVVGQERKDLAATLSLTETQVKVWFQNRRTKYKRMKQEEEEEGGPKVPGQSSAGASSPEHSIDLEADIEDEEEEDDEEMMMMDSEGSRPSSPNQSKVSHHLNKWRTETQQQQQQQQQQV